MTIQMTDTLCLDGETHDIARISLADCPIREVQQCLPTLNKSISMNRSGYRCGWEVRGDDIWLTEFKGFLVRMHEQVTLNDLLPGVERGVRAYWLTCTIEIPQGEDVEIAPEMTHPEGTLLLEIESGSIVKRTLRDNSEEIQRLINRWRELDERLARSRAKREKENELRAESVFDEDLPEESELEAAAWHFMSVAMGGGVDASVRKRWQAFMAAAQPHATDYEATLLEMVDNAMSRRGRK